MVTLRRVGRRAAGLMAGCLMVGSVAAYEQPLLFRGELALGYDSNVANASASGDRRSDTFAEAVFSVNRLYTAGLFLSMELEGSLRARSYRDYDRLSHVAPEALLRINYRPAGGFHTPTLSGWTSWEHRESRSELRDGSIHRVGASWRQPLTTRITGRLNGRYAWRRADNTVFDHEFRTLGVELEWEPVSSLVVYGGVSRRQGALVTVGGDNPDRKAASRAWLADDAFADAGEEQLAYRLSDSARQYTLGVNHALGSATSLEVQWQYLDAQGSYGAGYRRWIALVAMAHAF